MAAVSQLGGVKRRWLVKSVLLFSTVTTGDAVYSLAECFTVNIGCAPLATKTALLFSD
jgi:hypothetical protein